MGRISTHVLDNALGRPAAGVAVRLYRADGTHVATGVTDKDGRIGQLGATYLPAGTYKLVFDTGSYFAAAGQQAFYPEVTVSFAAADGDYHIPLLLSPYAYSTYRGS
jgi:5-hydroxyisourate hydrolase